MHLRGMTKDQGAKLAVLSLLSAMTAAPAAAFSPSAISLGRLGGSRSMCSPGLVFGGGLAGQPHLPLFDGQSSPHARHDCATNKRASSVALKMGPTPPSSPPPSGSMSKAEQADLNFALWDAAKNGETDKVAR